MKWMWQQPENVANHNSAWGYETEQHYSCPVWWGIKYWLDPSESTRYKGENEPSLFQAVLPFVAVGSLTCLGSIFLAVKMSGDDWELLTPQHDSTLLDLSVSISHSSAPPQKPCFLTCFFSPFTSERALPSHCSAHRIITAASQAFRCEAWRALGERGNFCSALNCPGKRQAAFCCALKFPPPLLRVQFSLKSKRMRNWNGWCEMLFKSCLIKKCKTKKEWTFLAFSDPLSEPR